MSEYAAQRIYERVFIGGNVHSLVLLPNSYLLSAVIRDQFEASGKQEVFVQSLDQLQESARKLDSPFEAVDRILLHIARSSERAGAAVEFTPPVDYPIAFAQDSEEFEYFLQLAKQLGHIEAEELPRSQTVRARFRPEGWLRLGDLQHRQPELHQAFVAMAFTADMRSIYAEGFEPALLAAGYKAVRADLIQHNAKVDDRIISELRRSGLIVADFTGQRQNVYFEAGFAMGLGRHVICTCRDDSPKKLHFDIRQYNHVVWSDASDLREKLQQRVEATIIGRPGAPSIPAPRPIENESATSSIDESASSDSGATHTRRGRKRS